MKRHIALFPAIAIAVVLGGHVARSQTSIPVYVSAAINDFKRPPLERQRDKVLQPAEILAFAGVKPGMAVVDLMPEGGYYTRLLSSIVGAKGHVWSVVPRVAYQSNQPIVKELYIDAPVNRVERARVVAAQPGYQNVRVLWEWFDGAQYPTDGRYVGFAVPEQLDVLFTAYDYHALKGSEFAKVNMPEIDKNIYRSMKNGGVVIVVDNAAAQGAPLGSASTAIGRIDPELVKAEMTAAGFVFDGKLDVLAYPADDHTKPADDWSLERRPVPSDGFVLRFKKPLDAPNTDKRPKDPLKALAAIFDNTLVSGAGDPSKGVDPLGVPSARIHYMHADGTYQELGRTGTLQSGYWFYNADGWNCRIHLVEHEGRDMTDCAAPPGTYEDKKVGVWWQAQRYPYIILPGYQYYRE